MNYNWSLFFIDLFAIIYLTYLAVREVIRITKDGKMIHIIYLLYYVLYAYPLIFVMFSWGYEYEYFQQYNDSMTDFPTRIVTNVLVCFFAYYITRNEKRISIAQENKYIELKTDSIFFKLLLLFLIFYPVIYVTAKGMLFKFIVYGAISQSHRVGEISEIYTVIFNWSLISLFCTGLYLITNKSVSWAERMILYLNIALVSIINGKRYILMMALIIIFLCSYIDKRISARKLIRVGIVLALALISYSFLYLSFIKNQIFTDIKLFESLYIDLSRYDRLASVVYSRIHPDRFVILEFPMQTVLYYLLFFVPRSVWPNKPYPYQYCYSYSIHYPSNKAYSYDYVNSNWSFRGISGITTNFIDELICNAGIFLGVILVCFIIKLLKKYMDYYHDTLKYIMMFLVIYMMLFSIDIVFVFGILAFSLLFYRTNVKQNLIITIGGKRIL